MLMVNRLAGEFNEYVAALWQALVNGWQPPTHVTKDEYSAIRANPESYEPHLVGYVAICCSYSGKWFGGYAGITETRDGLRDYQEEAHRNTMKQVQMLGGLQVHHSSYDQLPIPPCSIIYCDPPYEGTTKYKDQFDHEQFWQWCRLMTEHGHTVFVSEYNAPTDFKCVWQKEVKSSLSANGVSGGNKNSVEKLFTYDRDTPSFI